MPGMKRARVRRWTRENVPAPWDYLVPATRGTIHGRVDTWRRAYDRTMQIINDQT